MTIASVPEEGRYQHVSDHKDSHRTTDFKVRVRHNGFKKARTALTWRVIRSSASSPKWSFAPSLRRRRRMDACMNSKKKIITLLLHVMCLEPVPGDHA